MRMSQRYQAVQALTDGSVPQKAMGDASQIKVSLRSLGAEDTTVISQAYGGGGHRNASSCVMPLSEFQSWEA